MFLFSKLQVFTTMVQVVDGAGLTVRSSSWTKRTLFGRGKISHQPLLPRKTAQRLHIQGSGAVLTVGGMCPTCVKYKLVSHHFILVHYDTLSAQNIRFSKSCPTCQPSEACKFETIVRREESDRCVCALTSTFWATVF